MSRPALVILLTAPLWLLAQPAPKDPPARAAPDRLDGPPFVTAKAWAVVDGQTGRMIGGGHEADRRPMASTTKILTAWLVLGLAADDPKVLDEAVTFSERAAKTPGSSAKLTAGEKVATRELLYGLLLPSGNDAAVALAEHFGPRLKSDKADGLDRFVAELNRRARELGLKETSYADPNGLSKDNVSSARDLAALACRAMRDERFRSYVGTRRHTGTVTGPDGKPREVTWTNTNQLLDIEGYDGVKTGTTTPAGACLVASGRRGPGHVIVVVLGSTSGDARYTDARNLFRWAWHERGIEASPPGR
jgi:serine-type D-Ala-D-Ala carboxypeptidase (penicillin-binding protein 5/6)